MTDAAYLELLASYEAAIDAASFALKAATALADGLRSTVQDVSADMEYLWLTNVYLSALITNRYGLTLSPRVIKARPVE